MPFIIAKTGEIAHATPQSVTPGLEPLAVCMTKLMSTWTPTIHPREETPMSFPCVFMCGDCPGPRDRWIAVIANGPSLQHVPRQEARNPNTGQVVSISGDMWQWTPDGATKPLATFSDRGGTISVRCRRDEDFFAKVRDLAAAFRAIVRDDEAGPITAADLPERCRGSLLQAGRAGGAREDRAGGGAGEDSRTVEAGAPDAAGTGLNRVRRWRRLSPARLRVRSRQFLVIGKSTASPSLERSLDWPVRERQTRPAPIRNAGGAGPRVKKMAGSLKREQSRSTTFGARSAFVSRPCDNGEASPDSTTLPHRLWHGSGHRVTVLATLLLAVGCPSISARLPQSCSPGKGYACLRVIVAGTGTVEAPSLGLVCHDDCVRRVRTDTAVQLHGAPDEGFQVGAWDGACAGAGAEADATAKVSSDASCLVYFVKAALWDDARAHVACQPRFSRDGGLLLCANYVEGTSSGRTVFSGSIVDDDLTFLGDGSTVLSLKGRHEINLVSGRVTPFNNLGVGGSTNLAISPDGQSWALTGDGDAVYLVNATTKVVTMFPVGSQVVTPSFDASGTHLLVKSFTELLVVDVASQEVVERHPGHVDGAPAWTSDGRIVAWVEANADGSASRSAPLHVWNRQEGTDTTLTESATPGQAPAFRPDGAELAAFEQNGHIKRWAIPSFSALPDLTVPLGTEPTVESQPELAYSPDGRSIGFSTEQFDGTIDVETQHLRIFHAGTRDVTQVTWSAAEDVIESVDLMGLLVSYDAATGRITGVSDMTQYPAVSRSPDGHWRAFSDSSGTSVEDLTARTTARISNDVYTRLDFSPDSKWLLAGSDREVGLFKSGTFAPGVALPQLMLYSDWANGGTTLVGVDDTGFVSIAPETGEVLGSALLTNVDVKSLRVGASARGGLAAAVRGKSMFFWDVNSTAAPELHQGLDDYAAFAEPSPDGAYILVGGEGTNVYTPDGAHVIALDSTSRSAAWSPSGTRVAVGAIGCVRVFRRVEWP